MGRSYFFSNRRRQPGNIIRGKKASRRKGRSFRTAGLAMERLEERHMLAAGSLDTTFNPAGAVPGTLIADLGFIEDGRSVAVQADGKILIAGTVEHPTLGANSRNFGVARFLPDGQIDTTFGVGGIDGVDGLATADFFSGSDIAFDMTLDSLGRILVIGQGRTSGGSSGMGLVRFDTNGNLDGTFGTGGSGKTLQTISGQVVEPRSVALQSDGKIVLGGVARTGGSSTANFLVSRFTAGGLLDTTFNGVGYAITDFGGNLDEAFQVVVQGDGKIVAGGIATISSVQQFGMARYNTNGTLDTAGFGVGGLSVTNIVGLEGPQTPTDVIRTMAVQGDGKIVVGGSIQTTDLADAIVARFNTNGVLDSSFNSSGSQPGVLRVDISTKDFIEGLKIDANGDYIVVGSSQLITGVFPSTVTTDGRLFVMRVLANTGQLDPLFATGGIGLIDLLPGSSTEVFYDVDIQSDGKIIAGGLYGTDFLLARFEADDFVAPTINGASETDEGSLYTLNLVSSDPTINQWTINWGDGNVEIVSGNPTSVTHTYADGFAEYTISATVTTDNGTFAAGNTLDVTVQNVAPTLSISGDATVNEGAVYNLDLLSFDPGDDTITSWTINWGDGNIEVVSGNPTSATHIYADGDASYVISATATDEDGTFVAGNTVAVDVLNVAPTLVISGAADVDEGSVYTLNLSSFDPGDDTITSWTINWGDGNIEVVSGNPTSVTHIYADGDASYVISATATDEDGTFAAGNTVAVDVLNVAPVADDAIFTITENSPNGTLVGVVSATDPGDDVLTYDIAGGSGAAAFAIDANTGQITVADSTLLDYETSPVLTLEVEVSDGDGGVATALVTIDLINLASISGVVFVDVNQNGQYDANEPGINGVIIELHDEFGNPVLDDQGDPIVAVTNSGGFYLFEDLAPGTYQLFQIQPTGVDDGPEYLGSLGGTILGNDRMQLTIADVDAYDYAFAELGQQTGSGDAAGIGFWQNKHGQALITQGGSQLASWLTATFPNVFGNSLAGASGSDVATFYREQLFKQQGKKSLGPAKVDAQFMAVALATYFTNQNLAGMVAASYGFNVTHTGIGTNVVNVGNKGAAFGVANGTDLTILQLLLATNNLTDQPDLRAGFAAIYDIDGDGVISAAEAALRTMANEIFSSINESGGI